MCFVISELEETLDKVNKEQKELQNNMEYWKVGIVL